MSPKELSAILCAATNWLESVGGALMERSGPEVCGFLIVDAARTPNLFVVPNGCRTSDRFFVSPQSERWARLRATELGGHVAAFVHTHPRATADLSAVDRRSLALQDLAWIVAGWASNGREVALYAPPGGMLVGRWCWPDLDDRVKM